RLLRQHGRRRARGRRGQPEPLDRALSRVPGLRARRLGLRPGAGQARDQAAFGGDDVSYKVANLDEIEEVNDGRCPWRGVRHHLGIQAFGINSWTARDAGDRIINEHSEEPDDDHGEEELYVVLEGHATFEVGEDKVDAPEGTLVFVPPGTRRTAFAEE